MIHRQSLSLALRLLLRCSLGLAMLSACSTQPPPESTHIDGDRTLLRTAAVDSLAISDSAVGPYPLGLSLDQLASRVATEQLQSVPRSPTDTGAVVAVLELREAAGRSLLRFGLDQDNRVIEVCVLNAAYNTADGLGVGSNLDELRSAITLDSPLLAGEELWLTDKQNRLHYRLDASQFTLSMQDELDVLTLPGTLVVTAVVLRR